MEKLLNKKQAAEILNVHPNTLDKWIRKGLVKSIVIATWLNGKKTRRFKYSDLMNVGAYDFPKFHKRKKALASG